MMSKKISFTEIELEEAVKSLIWIQESIEPRPEDTDKMRQRVNEFKMSMKTALKACVVVKTLMEERVEDIESEIMTEGEDE